DRPRVERGEITVTYRLWSRPKVTAGKRYPFADGALAVESVDLIPAGAVPRGDVAPSGCESVDAIRELAGEHTKTRVTPDTLLYRVQFRYLPGSSGGASAPPDAASSRSSGGASAPPDAASSRSTRGASAPPAATTSRSSGVASAPPAATASRSARGASAPPAATTSRSTRGASAPPAATASRSTRGASAPPAATS